MHTKRPRQICIVKKLYICSRGKSMIVYHKHKRGWGLFLAGKVALQQEGRKIQVRGANKNM